MCVESRMAGIIVTFDVVHVDSADHTLHLIYFADVVLEVRVVADPPLVALQTPGDGQYTASVAPSCYTIRLLPTLKYTT